MEDNHSFLWRIHNFSELHVSKLYSDTFTVLGYKWRILCYPKGNNVDQLSLYLDLADSSILPTGMGINTAFKLVVPDRTNNQFSKAKTEYAYLFTKEKNLGGFPSFMSLSDLRRRHRDRHRDNFYLVNDTLVVKVYIFKAEPIRCLTTVSNVVPVLAMEPQEPKAFDDSKDVPNIPLPDPTTLTEAVQLEGSNGLPRTEVVHLPDLPETKVENANVNGFQVPASKADAVELIFEKHPEFVSNFHFKNKRLRSAFMNAILAVIEKFCQSPVDFSDDDLSYSRDTLTDLENAGFQVDWLNTKLEEVVRRKQQAAGSKLDELIKQLDEMKQMMLDLESKIIEEKAETEAARASLAFNDIV